MEPTALVTRFADPSRARRYVAALRRAGFRRNEVGVVAPRRELRARQALIGGCLGALAGAVLGIFVGAYLTGTIPGVNPWLTINPFLGIALTMLVAAVIGLIPGVLVALLVPPEDSGEAQSDLAAVEQTLVVVQAREPERQEKALEILEQYRPTV